jgi:phytoene dehydrogenase-like protein
MNKRYDVLVIGAGHNGLVTAAYLAKAGLRACVVERRQLLGGAAATEAVFPGFKVNTGAVDAGSFLPRVVTDLALEQHGLRFIQGPAVVFAPQPDGSALTLWRDRERTRRELARRSPSDAERYPHYVTQVVRFASLLGSMLTLVPPALPEVHPGELLPWLRPALQLKRLGGQDMMEFLRLLPMPVSDFLDGWFQDPALKAALGAAGVTGSTQGPLASGTTFMLLYQAVGAGTAGFRACQFVRGGSGALSQALASAARQAGAEICTGVGVARIELDGERASGVRLENGEQLEAGAIVSSADPRHTFFDLVGASQLPVAFVREVKHIKFRGSTARLNLALSGLPRFAAAGEATEQLSGHILIAPDLEYVERASDAARAGQLPAYPMLDATLPSLLDEGLAPAGQHVLSVDVRYAPYHLAPGSWDECREQLVDSVIAILERYAPGMRGLILERQVLTPLDLEREYGLPEGSIYHGQMGLDQLLFMRPVAGYGQYHTPIQNLYLCGAGTHPGGGLTGAPGYNAARQVLNTYRRT